MRLFVFNMYCKMFFYYGFVDEKLAGNTCTSALAVLADTYKSDPSGRIMLIYEWLKLIYEGHIEPSKNEFDLEYPAYLKSSYQNGDITEKEMKSLLIKNIKTRLMIYRH